MKQETLMEKAQRAFDSASDERLAKSTLEYAADRDLDPVGVLMRSKMMTPERKVQVLSIMLGMQAKGEAPEKATGAPASAVIH